MSRELLAMALDALIYHTNQTRPIERTDTAITALRAALAQPEPIAYGMPRADGLILDVITPEEHESYSGEYTVPLYAAPPTAPIDGFGGNLDEAFERAPAVPDDAALNTLAKLFHRGEEIEGDDGAAMMVDLSLWHEASEAFDSLIGDGDGETLASSAAPAVPDDIAAIIACLGDDAALLRETTDDSEEIAQNMDDAAAALERLSAAPAVLEPLTDEQIDALWRAPMSADWEHREFARAIEAHHGIGGGGNG